MEVFRETLTNSYTEIYSNGILNHITLKIERFEKKNRVSLRFLECGIGIGISELSVQHTGKIIDEKVVLLPQDFINGTYLLSKYLVHF